MGDDKNWAISSELFDVLRSVLPEGRILELGSGAGTQRLLDAGYKVTSIEHDERYLNLYGATYIHAPIREFRKQCAIFPHDKGWYDREVLEEYDLILVDGPPARFGRGGFYKWFDLFNHDVPMIFDDVHRGRETTLIRRVSANLKVPFTVYGTWTDKHFAVIDPRKKQ